MLEAKLVIIGGPNVAQEFPLTLPATIGRGTENGIPLAHPLVSRRHCELFEEDDQLFVRDLGSLNGTFVGNQPAEGITRIEPGQLLTIGTVTFRAVYGGYHSDIYDDADVLDGAFAGDNGDALQEDGAERTMIRPAAAGQAITETLRADGKAAGIDPKSVTNSGFDTETTVPAQTDTERMPPASRQRKRRSR